MGKSFKDFYDVKTKTDELVENIKETDNIKVYDEDSFMEFQNEFIDYLNDHEDELYPVHGGFYGSDSIVKLDGVLTHGATFSNNFEDLASRIVYDYPEGLSENEWNPDHHKNLNKIAEKYGYGITSLRYGVVYIYGLKE